MLGEAYGDQERIHIWRTTTTSINDPSAIAQTTRFYRVNTGVELLGVSRGCSCRGLRLCLA
jgi:hypothetical protein